MYQKIEWLRQRANAVKVLYLIFLLVLLCACTGKERASSESIAGQADQTLAASTVEQTTSQAPNGSSNPDVSAQQGTPWLLMYGENDSESLDQLVDLTDPTGSSYVRIEDVIKSLHAKSGAAYPWYELYLGGISTDGSRIALVRQSHELDHQQVGIYDLSTAEKLLEVDMPNQFIQFSPDLESCVYEMDHKLYVYRFQNQTLQELKAPTNQGAYEEGAIYGVVYSPDSLRLAIQTGGSLFIVNLQDDAVNPYEHAISTDLELKQWLSKDQLLYIDTGDNGLSLVDMTTGESKRIGQPPVDSREAPLMTWDGEKLLLAEESGPIVEWNWKSNNVVRYQAVLNRIGYTLRPVQRIESRTDFTPYRTSIPVQEITASSTLPDQSGNNYNPANLMDGNANTAWCEGVAGDGVGEWVKLDFGQPQVVNGIEILNGLTKSKASYLANNRFKRVQLEFSEGQRLVMNSDALKYELDEPVRTSWIKLTILEVESGTAYPDTCISEVRVF
ncbi:discoidin domain-containing protein [Paenibacillus massiliensis]|uniref:discoidin domain-containing protein n=1 Tax=Paenibacillus massiliensis TaxID=225917 RepID=UPI00037DB138|nr:discoidin domain-containing protein [Paenibacillus massiliensis]